jgi:hypothetical protein
VSSPVTDRSPASPRPDPTGKHLVCRTDDRFWSLNTNNQTEGRTMVVGLVRRHAENEPPPARLFRRPAQAAPFPQPQHFTNTAPTGTATNHSDYVSIPRGKEAGGGAWHVAYSLLEPRPAHPTPEHLATDAHNAKSITHSLSTARRRVGMGSSGLCATQRNPRRYVNPGQ